MRLASSELHSLRPFPLAAAFYGLCLGIGLMVVALAVGAAMANTTLLQFFGSLQEISHSSGTVVLPVTVLSNTLFITYVMIAVFVALSAARRAASRKSKEALLAATSQRTTIDQ